MVNPFRSGPRPRFIRWSEAGYIWLWLVFASASLGFVSFSESVAAGFSYLAAASGIPVLLWRIVSQTGRIFHRLSNVGRLSLVFHKVVLVFLEALFYACLGLPIYWLIKDYFEEKALYSIPAFILTGIAFFACSGLLSTDVKRESVKIAWLILLYISASLVFEGMIVSSILYFGVATLWAHSFILSFLDY